MAFLVIWVGWHLSKNWPLWQKNEKRKKKKKFFHFGFPFEKFKTENKVEVA